MLLATGQKAFIASGKAEDDGFTRGQPTSSCAWGLDAGIPPVTFHLHRPGPGQRPSDATLRYALRLQRHDAFPARSAQGCRIDASAAEMLGRVHDFCRSW